jgi:hypothetical protein
MTSKPYIWEKKKDERFVHTITLVADTFTPPYPQYIFLTAFKVSYMKVSERARQSSIIDLYIHMYIYAYMSENDLLTDRHSLVNFENKSGELWRILTISFILSIIYSVNRFLWCNIETIVSTCIVLFMYICVRSLSSFKLSFIQYVRVREIKEHRERESSLHYCFVYVSICVIEYWTEVLFSRFFFQNFFFLSVCTVLLLYSTVRYKR